MRKGLRWLYLILVVIFLYMPVFTLMVFSFNQGKTMARWSGFSFKWYKEMISDQLIMGAIGNTLVIAIVSAAVATLIGTLGCIGLVKMKVKPRKVLLGLNNIPLLNADIVIGISLMMTFLAFGVTLSMGTVMFSHITFCIPYVILSVLPKFRELSPNIYEAALDLGATPVYAFRKVVLPDIRPGIIAGFLLSFTMSVDDFVITHFTRGAGVNTISTLIYSQVKVGIRPTLFALSTIIFIAVFVLLLVVNIISRRSN